MAWIVSRTWSCIGEGGSIGGEEGVLGLSDILSSLKIFTPSFLLSSLPHSFLSAYGALELYQRLGLWW